MDQKLEKRRYNPKTILTISACAGIALSLAAWASMNSDRAVSVSINTGNLEIGEAKIRSLQEKISLRGNFVPLKTIYLDAVEGGRVEKILVEDGAVVKEGDVLVELSNASLQLDIISREAQIVEQLNNLQSTRLAVEQNRLSLKRDLSNFDYQISRLTRIEKQQKTLIDKKLISDDTYKQTIEELGFQRRARSLTLASQEMDDRLRTAQMNQLESSITQQNRNLALARKNLDNLSIKASMGGRLSSLDAELGQTKSQGARLGQIDMLNAFKIIASVDEFYLAQLDVDQRAFGLLDKARIELRVDKIDSRVEDGKFIVEFSSQKPLPTPVRRGQNLSIELPLSDEKNALSIPAGSFINDTGGNWAFVINNSGDKALRRQLKLGRRDQDYVEVLSGLQEGERVIISPYANFGDYNELTISKE